MDECDTVVKAMECGKNNAPDTFEDVMNTVDKKTVVRFYLVDLLNFKSIKSKE
jgi:hypothetical protein